MDNAQAIERANAYRDMMNSWPWKDFYANVLGEIKKDAILEVMKKDGDISSARGSYQTIEKIESELDYILNGTKL